MTVFRRVPPRRHPRLRRRHLLPLLLLGGCSMRLDRDQIARDQTNFGEAMLESQKRQMLLNILRLRYGELPMFLDVNQVISGYSVQRSLEAGLNVFREAGEGNYGTLGGSIQFQENPTFTFTPLTGERLARSVVRPLDPGLLLPLMVGGLPADLLLRLAVQSIGLHQNSNDFLGEHDGASPNFMALAADLRTLQLAGGFTVRTSNGGERPRVELVMLDRPEASIQDVQHRVLRLLRLPSRLRAAEVVYGQIPTAPNQIPMMTRSPLGILAQISRQVAVPDRHVSEGRTLPSPGGRTRPAVVVHSGTRVETEEAFASARFQDHWFWIDEADYPSKVAFTISQLLLMMGQLPPGQLPVITIPAG